MKMTDQMREWAGDFGRDYTDRNLFGPKEMNALYIRSYGKSRTKINNLILGNIDRSSTILEVGANIGTQLLLLKEMGFCNLYGIELQIYAINKAKSGLSGIKLIQASAFDMPFKDNSFDIVYTSGVLIHISPRHINYALSEIYRCSRRFIYGLEHFDQTYHEVEYRGKKSMLWNTDYAELYKELFGDLMLVKELRLPYLSGEMTDSAFLLEKKR